MLLLGTVCFLVFAPLARVFQSGNSKDATLSISVTSAQVLSVFGTIDLRWPESLRGLLDSLGAFSFNVELVSPGARIFISRKRFPSQHVVAQSVRYP